MATVAAVVNPEMRRFEKEYEAKRPVVNLKPREIRRVEAFECIRAEVLIGDGIDQPIAVISEYWSKSGDLLAWGYGTPVPSAVWA